MDSDVNIDLSQFHGIFFEECAEGIAIMEAELLNLNIGAPDLEQINTIFRAAHSIKGSAGTFGFPHISEFTHGMETALNEMRNGTLEVSSEGVEVLLAAVDCLRVMIDCSKNDKPLEDSDAGNIRERLDVLIGGAAEQEVSQTVAVEEKQQEEGSAVIAWFISFYPHENLFYTGNDPFRLIRELKSLGDLEVIVDTSRLPDFNEMDAENCYLEVGIV
jgi:two-component system chemotaxis sensor kinase CheA